MTQKTTNEALTLLSKDCIIQWADGERDTSVTSVARVIRRALSAMWMQRKGEAGVKNEIAAFSVFRLIIC